MTFLVIGIESGQVPKEIARFEAALMQTRAQILEMQQSIAEAIGAKDAEHLRCAPARGRGPDADR